MPLGKLGGMARKRTKLTMSAAETAQVKAQIRSATDPRDKERLQVVLWATGGQHGWVRTDEANHGFRRLTVCGFRNCRIILQCGG